MACCLQTKTENTAFCRILSLDCTFGRLLQPGRVSTEWLSLTWVSLGGTASKRRCLLAGKLCGASGVGVLWASVCVCWAGYSNNAMWGVLSEGRRGGKLSCRKPQGEMFNKEIVCLFEMIMGEQESLLKATNQADSSPCFLMWESSRGVCNERRCLSAKKPRTTEAVLRESICSTEEKKSFSARSISY